MRVFHVTPRAEDILRVGFLDRTGDDYGFGVPVTGVFVSDSPVGAEEANGSVLVITLPDDLDLDDYAIVEEGAPPDWRREWLIPAEVLNRLGSVERAAL